MKKQFLAVTIILALSGAAHARTIRASELSSEQWGQALQSGQQVTVEFRQGDEIPVSFSAQGDFLETSQAGVSFVKVKKNFWLRMVQNELQASIDGLAFNPLKDIATGSFEVGAGNGQTQPGVPVNAINMILSATLK